jgi:hypothetical protein
MAAEIFRNFLIVDPKSWSLGLIEIGSSVALRWALRTRLRGFVEGEERARNTCDGAALGRAKRSASDISVTLMFFKNA